MQWAALTSVCAQLLVREEVWGVRNLLGIADSGNLPWQHLSIYSQAGENVFAGFPGLSKKNQVELDAEVPDKQSIN